jgi:hypothetical protein
MTDEAPDVTAIWARINEINLALESLSTDAGSNILRRDAGRRNADFEQRSAVLRRELAELRAKLPPAGMASGMRLVMSRALGEIILRDDPELSFADVRTPVDEWDWSES